MGVWLLDEPFNAWIIAGTVLVMAGVLVVTRQKVG
jgi:drug/metabolite transporter (DMT)-like permease